VGRREDVDVDALLAEAKAAAEGRERWRKSPPIWKRLREAGVSYDEIKEATGVSPATVARLARLARRGRSAT
jgi:uncharacterized protein YerC